MVMNIGPMERLPIPYAAYHQHAILNRPPSRPPFSVIAGDFIPINASTGVIEETALQKSYAPDDHIFSVAHREGQLFCLNIPLGASYWIRLITLASNMHNENVTLEPAEQGVALRTKREIHPGQPLMMWFSGPLLSKMNIPPYLGPHNIIQTEHAPTYRCHRCSRLFGDPNPLKIHIALDCNKLTLSDLWNKLTAGDSISFPENFRLTIPKVISYHNLSLPYAQNELKSPKIRPSEKLYSPAIHYPKFEVPATAVSTEASASSSDETSPNTSMNSSVEVSKSPIADHQNSAFKPYPKQVITHNAQELIPRGKMMYDYPPPMNPYFPANLRTPVPMPNISNEVQAAQMETFFSNLGKGKDGHHCLYCNRVYSRKYGLKIHIRTHTGYKPLKCKICSRPFGDPSNLNKHVRLHAEGGDTPYKCDLCDKVLVRRRDLERHMKTRHQDKEDGSTPTPC